MNDWSRKRPPDEVPTPLAVAVSDFCRRAKQPASAAEVREALSFLGGSDDARVRSVTDAEPAATPLGPFALVDIIQGTTVELAAHRQGCGYYELIRKLAPPLAERPAPAEAPTPAPRAPQKAPVPRPRRAAKRAAAVPVALSERIGPKRRAAGSAAAVAVEMEAVETPAAPRRELPAPRGRFTRLPSPKRPIEDLFEPEGRDAISGLIDQQGHRLAVLKALVEQFEGRQGAPLAAADLDAAIERHGLAERLERRERELLLSAYREHRGASGRVAWALDLKPGELVRLVKAAGLANEVDEARERFKREALASDLRLRLDLLGRRRYLVDLGIVRRFNERLAADLLPLLEGCLDGVGDLAALAAAAAKKHGLEATQVERAVDELGLASPLRDRLSRGAAGR